MNSPPDAGATPRRKQFWVYVIELDPAKVSKTGPNGAVYVGETSLSPEQRFQKHLNNARVAARIVKRAGVRLRPDLAPSSPFLSRRSALNGEARTKRRLENRGYHVYGGQGLPFMGGT